MNSDSDEEKDHQKLPNGAALYSQAATQPHHYFKNAFWKQSDGLRVREGTPISTGHPNDFPSPRKGAEDVPKAPKKKMPGLRRRDDDEEEDDTKQQNKYYSVLPYLHEIPSEYNPRIAKIQKTT